MRSKTSFHLFILFFCTISSIEIARAQTIEGTIKEEYSLEPIPAAIVLLMKEDSTVIQYQTTNGNGYFNIDVKKPGKYIVGVRKMDYSKNFAGPFNLAKKDTLNIEMRVFSTPKTMEAIVVEGERIFEELKKVEFYERQRSTGGYFFTRKELYKYGSIPPSFFFRSQTQTKVNSEGRLLNKRNISRDCYMTVFVDNMELPDFSTVDQVISKTDDIIGIEIYSGLASPNAFTLRSNGCGTVLIWTNRY